MKKILICVISIAFLSSCTKSEDDSAKTCRNYVTQYTVTSSGNTSTKFYTWNSSSLIYSFESGTTNYQYASKNDFVDEGRTLGLKLYTSAKSGSTTTTYTYNSSKQLISSSTSGGLTLSYTYSAWDSKNRPTTGLYTSGLCTNQNIAYQYDDTALTVKQTFSGGTGTCTASTTTTTYDTNFNQTSYVSGSYSETYSTKATAQECY